MGLHKSRSSRRKAERVKLIEKRDVYAVELKNAKYYDCGSKTSYLKAVVDHALEHEDINGEFREYLKSLKL